MEEYNDEELKYLDALRKTYESAAQKSGEKLSEKPAESTVAGTAVAASASDCAPLLQNPVLTSVYYDKEKKDKKGGKIVRNVCVHYTSPECPDVYFNISGRSKFFGFEVDIVGTLGRIGSRCDRSRGNKARWKFLHRKKYTSRRYQQ